MQEDHLIASFREVEAAHTIRLHGQAGHKGDILALLFEQLELMLHALHAGRVLVQVAWMVDLPRTRELERVIRAVLF